MLDIMYEIPSEDSVREDREREVLFGRRSRLSYQGKPIVILLERTFIKRLLVFATKERWVSEPCVR